MQCLNIKNKEVAALLDEYTKLLGSYDAAYYVISENNGYGLDKAPNGEPSKLFSDLLTHYKGDRVATIHAKAKVYSKSFKNWFGDWGSEDKTNVSKVVDDNGEPLVVYHGTDASFDTFQIDRESRYGLKDGAYFTSNKKFAKGYTTKNTIIPAFLSIKDPFTFNANKVVWTDISFKEVANALNIDEDTLKNLVPPRYQPSLLQTIKEIFGAPKNSKYAIYDVNRLVKLARLLNKDGGYFTNVVDSGKTTLGMFKHFNADQIVILDPNQVKSVDNQGTFSTQEDNIYYQRTTNKEQRLLNFWNNYVKLRSRSIKPAEDEEEHRKRMRRLSGGSKLYHYDPDKIFREILGIDSRDLGLSEFTFDDAWVDKLDSITEEEYLNALTNKIDELKKSNIPAESLTSALYNIKKGYYDITEYSEEVQKIFARVPKYREATELPKNSRAKTLAQYNAYQKHKYNKELKAFENGLKVRQLRLSSRIYHLETIKMFLSEYENAFRDLKLKVIDEYLYRSDYNTTKLPKLQKFYNILETLAKEQNELDVANNKDQIENIKKVKNIKEALDLLAEKVPEYADIISYLKKTKIYDEAIVTVIDNLESSGLFGTTVGITRIKIKPEVKGYKIKIEIGGNSYGYRTLMHEIIHAFTTIGLNSPNEEGWNEFVEDIDNIINYCSRYYKLRSKIFGDTVFPDNLNYGFTSPEEFVAEFFSNPAFQMLLKETPAISEEEVKYKNMFQEVIEAITKFFARLIGGNSKPANLYDQIEPLMYKIIDMQAEAISEWGFTLVNKPGATSTQDNNIYKQQNASSQDPYEIHQRLMNLQKAYDSINNVKNLYGESFTFRSDAWDYIRRNGWTDVAYVYQNRGMYHIGKYSKDKFANVRALLEDSLNDAYYQSLSSDEIMSQQALDEQEEQERFLSPSNSANPDYEAYLNSDESHMLPMWEDTGAMFNTPVKEITEPATGSDKTITSRLFNNKSRVSAGEIIANLKGNPAIAKLVEILELQLDSSLKDVQIAYVPYGANETGASGLYYHDNGNITIFGDAKFRGKGNTADVTVLHELIHAATINKLKSNPLAYESAQRILDSARKQLSEKYGMPWENLLARYPDVFYGLTNVYEFFSETFSSSRFIFELSSLPAEGETKPLNFLQGIVKWLMNLFVSDTKRKGSKNLYEQAAGELENIMFNVVDPLAISYDNAYKDALFNDDSLIFASIQRTNDETKIKHILSQQNSHINFEADSHTYTNVETGDVYTPVSVVKDAHGYGADVSAMSDETLAYGEYAAKVGTAIHDYMHHLLTGEKLAPSEIKLSDSAKKMINDVVLPRIIKKDDKVLASEQIISNDSAKIAGTVDLLVKDKDGKIHLKDFKTKARTFKGKSKYGFDYYFSSKQETKAGGKPDASRHDYQLTMYKRMLELLGINVDHKEIIPLEYTVNKDGVITEVWIPDLDYAQSDGSIYHRTNNALEQEINQTVLSADSNATTSQINTENLVMQSEIVANILKVLKNQLAIYRVKGYTTRSEVLKKTIDELNSLEESEVIISYVNKSVELLKPLIDSYNADLQQEQAGNQNVWSLHKLEAWKNYAESFSNLDDIQNYLFLNPTALSGLNNKAAEEFKETLATVISYRNILENAYKSKGEKIWLNWLAPFTTRVEAEYRREAERQYKKDNKGSAKLNDTVAMNNYIERYVNNHRNEIDLKSRELLRQQSKIATSSPVGSLSRMVDTVFESSDTIVGSMARAYHTTWMESLDDFNATYKELISLTEELERAFPSYKSNPAKLYDFMIESDEFGSNLISKLSPKFISTYEQVKREIYANPKYETSKEKAIAISAWLNENAPIKRQVELKKKKSKVIDDLLAAGRISQKEHEYLIKNEKKDQSLKQSWADLVYRKRISEEVADYLRIKFNELNWEHREPLSDKYPNKKWNELQKIRENNPQDIRVRFFDFITDLSKRGDSYVPDRFKLNGRLPGMSKVMAERAVSGDIAGQLKEAVKKEFTIRADDTDKGMQMTDELDRPIKFIPIFFTNVLPANEQSLDIATIYKEWFRSVNNYKYINEILPQLKYTKWVVENRKTIKTDSEGNPIKNVLSKIMNNGTSDIDPTTNALITDDNLVSQLNSWFDQVIYGIDNKNLGTFMGMDNAKLLSLFQKYTSLRIMGLNAVSMVNNALMAEVQQAVESFANQYVSSSSYTKATGEYLADLPNILGDIGSRKITSLTNLLNEHFGVFTDFNEGSMLDNNRLKKLGKISTLYFTTNVGEHEAQSRFLIASLIEKRALNKKGEDIGSMYDYFTVENGKLVFDKNNEVANFSRKDQIAFGQQVTAIIRKMHGNYAKYSKVALQQYSIGKLALMFRKWIWTTGKRRFAKEYYDEYGQTFSKGYYRDGSAFYYNKVRGFFQRLVDESKALEYAEKADWDTMTESEKANVKRFTTELCIFLALMVMSTLLDEFKPDDDDTVTAYVYNHLDYQIFRLSTDITFYILPSSFMKIVQSPIPSSSVLRSASNFFEALLHPTARFERGDMKGELKIKKRALDLIPLTRQIYRLRNIDDERQLLKML